MTGTLLQKYASLLPKEKKKKKKKEKEKEKSASFSIIPIIWMEI